jgi:hypothetical protein
MAFRDYFVLSLFVILSLCFLSRTTQGQSSPGENSVTFNFKNELPNNNTLTFTCFKEKHPIQIVVNVTFNHDYLFFNKKLICNASWSQFFTTFVAYDADERVDNKVVWCYARENGVYKRYYRNEGRKIIADTKLIQTWSHKSYE